MFFTSPGLIPFSAVLLISFKVCIDYWLTSEMVEDKDLSMRYLRLISISLSIIFYPLLIRFKEVFFL